MQWIDVTEVFSRALPIYLEYLLCEEAVAPKDATAYLPNGSLNYPGTIKFDLF